MKQFIQQLSGKCRKIDQKSGKCRGKD